MLWQTLFLKHQSIKFFEIIALNFKVIKSKPDFLKFSIFFFPILVKVVVLHQIQSGFNPNSCLTFQATFELSFPKQVLYNYIF